MSILPAVILGSLLTQAPAPSASNFDRSQIVIRDGPEGRAEPAALRPPGPPLLPLAESFWTPPRLALGVAVVIIAGVAASVVVARSKK